MPLLNNPNIAQQLSTAYQTVPNAQALLAQANLQNQQAQTAGLQNYKTQAEMPLFMQYLQQVQDDQNEKQVQNGPSTQPGGFGTQQDAQPQGTTQQSAPQAAPTPLQDEQSIVARIGSHLDAKFAQDYTPETTAPDPATATRLKNLETMAGFAPEFKSVYEAELNKFNAQQAYKNQVKVNQANKLYGVAYQVATASQNGASARQTFEQLDHQDAQYLPQSMSDEDIEKYASHITGSLFKYTNRGIYVDKGGYFRDATTDQPIPGMEQDRVKMSPDDANQTYKYWHTPVEYTDKTGHKNNILPHEIANMEAEKNHQPPPYINADDAFMQHVRAANSDPSSWKAEGQVPPQPVNPSKGNPKPGAVTLANPSVGGPSHQLQADVATVPWQKAPIGTPNQGQTNIIPPRTARGSAPNPNGITSAPTSSDVNPLTAGALRYDANNVTPSFDVNKLSQRPMANGAYGENLNNDQTEAVRTYAQQKADQQLQSAQNTINTDKQMLMLKPTAKTGIGTAMGARIQNFVQTFKQNPDDASQFINHVNMFDPASREVLNKLLNVVSIKDMASAIGEEGDTARFSAIMAQLGMKNTSANAELLSRSIGYMVKWDLAKANYTAQMYGPDRIAADKAGRNMVNYPQEYSNIHQANVAVPATFRAMDQWGNIHLPGEPTRREGDQGTTDKGEPWVFHAGKLRAIPSGI